MLLVLSENIGRLTYLLSTMQQNENIAFISVFAGAGGDDAKDWAEMLLRMYRRYGERKNWKTRFIDDGVLEIKGESAYPALLPEQGVHRLVRISPYDTKKLRHTSFPLVEVLPETAGAETARLQIPESELKIEFYRSSGPGGQNVNKVETAVRMIHLPSGLRASSQAERTQSSNRERAMALLRAKLLKAMTERQTEDLAALKTKVAPEWGYEIRSYVLHPYKMVKDHKTRKKITKVGEVLDGNLDLLMKIKEK